MKICHFSNRFAPCEGGIEKVVLDYCLEMKKRGHESKVVCLNKCAHSGKKLPKKSTEQGIEVERVPFLDLGFYRISPSILLHLKDCDVLHVHGIGYFADKLIPLKLFHGRPVIVSTHGGIFHTSPNNPLKKFYFYLWNRFLLRFADKVIAVSGHDLELFSRILPDEKIALVENGLRLQPFAGLGKKKKRNAFLFVGRLSKNKRVDLLLEAFSLAAKKNKSTKLFVVGGDFEGLLSGLKKKAKKLGISKQVKFTGKVSDAELLEHYSRAEFFASASEYEGFGVSALEAMASGCIPVLNAIPSFEKILSGGNAGFIADFSHPEKAAETLGKAFALGKARREKMSRAAKKRASQFSWDARIKQLLKVYKNSIKGVVL